MSSKNLKKSLITLTDKFVSKMASRIDDTEHMLKHADNYKTIAHTIEKLSKVVNTLSKIEHKASQKAEKVEAVREVDDETDLQKLEQLHATKNFFEGTTETIRELIEKRKVEIAATKFGIFDYCPNAKDKQIENSYYDT